MRRWILSTLAVAALVALTSTTRANDCGECTDKQLSFPTVSGQNLEGRHFDLPADLEGDLNLLLVAFKMHQQEDVNTWLPFAKELAAEVDGFNFYELPTMSAMYKPMQDWIDGGMARGIADRAIREATITLYIDTRDFRKALDIPSRNSIHALLTKPNGEIVWRAEGPLTDASKDGLRKAVEIQDGGDLPSIVEVAVGDDRFTTLVAALKAADLVDALSGEGPFTVFAPTNDAFAALPEGTVETLLKPEAKDKLTAVLTYHVAAGRFFAEDVVGLSKVETLQGSSAKIRVYDDGTVKIDDAKVIITDIACSNGVIHVIDSVILPGSDDKDAEKAKTIVDVAVADGRFTTLVAALKAADLVEALSGEGPFTVFAPTDDAFAKLPDGTVESLLKPENKDTLIAILTYHVVAGSKKAEDVVAMDALTTLQGEDVTVTVTDDGKVLINDAQVVITDIKTSNGIIHVIDSVILPPQ